MPAELKAVRTAQGSDSVHDLRTRSPATARAVRGTATWRAVAGGRNDIPYVLAVLHLSVTPISTVRTSTHRGQIGVSPDQIQLPSVTSSGTSSSA